MRVTPSSHVYLGYWIGASYNASVGLYIWTRAGTTIPGNSSYWISGYPIYYAFYSSTAILLETHCPSTSE